MPIPKQAPYEAPKSAKMRIYEALREWIIDGTLQPDPSHAHIPQNQRPRRRQSESKENPNPAG